MQVSFRKIFLGSLIAATFSMPAAAEIKVGVVDIAKLFEESPQAKVVQDSLRAEFGPRLQQLVAQEQALKARNDKYQKDLATMAADQRTKARKICVTARVKSSARKRSCRTIRMPSARKR